MKIDPEPTLVAVGGKAFQLCRLKQYFNVPPFFVVSFKNPQEISDTVVQQAILKECENRNFDLMAVRSSAVCEDSLKTSFAGMFETVLCVQPSQLIGAISTVLNSIFNKRVRDYCKIHDIDHNTIKMAVIVQKMINGRVSGVCFTRLKKEEDSLLIESCYGLGEALVSGEVTPDSYAVDRGTFSVLKENIGYQKVMFKIANNNDKKLTYEEIPFYKRNSRKLTSDEIRKIAKTCLEIEQNLHFDVADIEWTLEGDTLYVLQARPYTGFIAKKLQREVSK
jgi:pyruvate,water dikinase